MPLRQDLAFAWRMLRKTPALTAVAILALGLGIGANTAIFSLVDAVLLQPLPYPHPSRLVLVVRTFHNGGFNSSSSVPNFLDWRRQASTFSAMAGLYESNFSLAGHNGPPERYAGYRVDTNFFHLLGVPLQLGGGFQPSDDQPDRPMVAVISDHLWRSRFNSDPNIVGRVVNINDQPTPVVGVLPASFRFHGSSPPGSSSQGPDVFEPLQPESLSTDRGANMIEVIGRVRNNIPMAAALAQMQAIGDRLASNYPKPDGNSSAGFKPLQAYWTGNTRPALWLLFAAVGLVLLIACADLANLLLAKATARRSEIATRLALGATRGRIVTQLLTESFLLALAGGVVGLAIGLVALRAALPILPAGTLLDPSATTTLDPLVLAFTLVLALLTGILFGLAPALQVSRTDVSVVLQQESSRAGSSRHRLRRFLIVAELAIALPLLIAAGLLLSSLLRLRSVNPGFNANQLLTAQLSLASTRYRTPADLAGLTNQLLPRLRALPGIRSAALTLSLPLGSTPDLPVDIVGRPPGPQNGFDAYYIPSTSQIFAALGVPVLRGRGIADSDTEHSAPVAIINQTAAQHWFPHHDAIGQSIWIGKGYLGPALTDAAPRTIVGVVGDVRQRGLSQPPRDALYLPLSQTMPGAVPLITRMIPLSLAVRTAGPASAPAHAVVQAVWGVDPAQAVSGVRPMTDIVASAMAPQRFMLILLGVFAGLAVLLAAVGVYGVMSYSVAQRGRELGLRMALGASPVAVVRLVLGEGLRLAALGTGLGLAAAYALNRVLASFLFGVESWDPAIFLAAAIGLVCIALLACSPSAWRASRTNPAIVLRAG